jgi:hypothetical protein
MFKEAKSKKKIQAVYLIVILWSDCATIVEVENQ